MARLSPACFFIKSFTCSKEVVKESTKYPVLKVILAGIYKIKNVSILRSGVEKISIGI